MGKPGAPRRIAALLFVILGVVILCGLGVWQVQRLGWKTQLLAHVAALKDAPPVPVGTAFERLKAGQAVDYVRVSAACTGVVGGAHLYTVSDNGPAWRQVALCHLAGAPWPAVLLDLGFEVEAAGSSPVVETVTLAPGTVVTGVLRAGEARPLMAPLPVEGRFHWRDARAIAASLGAPDAAPVFLMLESPRAGPKLTPAPVPVDIPNNHLAYALTWFGLAAALAGVYTASRFRAGRKA